MSVAEPLPRVHPKIRARRVEVRREAGRRRLRLLVGAATILATVGAGWGLTRSPLLDIDRVAVSGAQHTDATALAAAVGAGPGHPMVDLDLPAIAADVERLPWVATATARRAWPGTLEITITERMPVAAVGFGDDWVQVDASGRVLAVADGGLGRLARVAAAAGSTTPAPGETLSGSTLDAVRLAAAALDTVGDHVDTVSIDDQSEAVLGLTGGINARIGASDQLDAKLTALATLLAKVDLRGVTTIDLRVPSAPVLTRG